ncbi:MAG: galactokinase, partial [Lachnospiraceae bacterium]|nr:galactokinase [Lachnospiraceae bacterium]
VTNVDIAKMGQIAESDYIGYYSSIMDHFACMMGIEDRAIYFDAKTMHYEYPPFKLGDAKLVIVYSQIEHVPDRNMHAARRAECARALRRLKQNVHINYLCDLSIDRFETFKDILMDDLLVKRTRHVVYENQRTIQAVSALRAHNIEKFGQYMYASHLSLRDNYEVTCEEIDYLVDTAMSIDGVIGSRMIGSGLGGSTVNIVKESAIPLFMETISQKYKKKTGLSVDFYGAWPAEGARAILP